MPKTPPKLKGSGYKYHEGIPVLVRSLAGRTDRGLTDKEVAEKVGVSVRTIHRWKKDHPEFHAALIETKAIFDARVEMSLFRRATGYRYTEVEVTTENDGKVTTKRVEREKEVLPDTGACKHWLVNRDPERWKERQTIEHSGEIKIDDARGILLARLMSLTAPSGEEPAP